MKLRTNLFKSGVCFLIIFSMFFMSACSNIFSINIPKVNEDTVLPSVESYQNLVELIKNAGGQQMNRYYLDDRAMFSVAETQSQVKAIESTGRNSNEQNGDYSTTNIQVQGVDESDIVKTDGQYIYQVNMNRIIISKVRPADQMEITNIIPYTDDSFYPSEIYLDDKYLVVIGNTFHYISIMPTESLPVEAQEPMNDSEGKIMREPDQKIQPFYPTRETVKVLIYNIENPEKPVMVRDFEVEGYYISSRIIDSQLYLITNRYIYYYTENMDENEILPWYRDSVLKSDFVSVDYDSIRYFPDSQEPSYLLIAGLNLDKIQDKINVEAYLGSGQTVYASLNNLYVTMPKWDYENVPVTSDTIQPSMETGSAEVDSAEVMPIRAPDVNTEIYRFTLENGVSTFAAKGEVPGTLLNQFSMDENNGFFRVATTTDSMWRNDEFTSQNNLYVLNSSLNIVGKIENIAPGERIYSVRFMGDRGYMVTFKTMDPLFVIDLKNPEKPEILGELKIPGYSDYLHPYDENHIIGFGMDASEVEIKDENGKVVGVTAYQMGMKVAMIDVSDVSNPVQKFSITIGDRGTYSDLLYNHKALVFSKEKNLMAFPVTVMEAKNKWMDSAQKIPNYGELKFQGMYVFSVDSENGFTLKTQITHLSDQEIKDAPDRWFDYQKAIERGLYIDDTFYTISKTFIKANSLDNYKELGTLEFPYNENQVR